MKKVAQIMKSRNTAMVLTAFFAMAIMFTPELAFAQDTIADMADAAKGNFTSLKELAISFGYLAGVILFVAGIWLVYKDSKQPGQDHAKKGFISILIGVALLSAPSLMEIFAASGGMDAGAVGEAMSEDAQF